MIREISQVDKVARFVTGTQGKNIRGHQEPVNPAPQAPQASLTKYTSSHVKANFLNYKASSAVSFGTGEHSPEPPARIGEAKTPSLSKNITKLPAYKLGKGHYYDELANDLAILMGPGKNALLTHDEGVSTELMVHNFTQNMLAKKYVNEGLHPYSTDVIMFDTKDCIAKNKPPLLELVGLASENLHRKKVVFIENFDEFMLELAGNGISADSVLKEGKLPNTQIVALMPKSFYNRVMADPKERAFDKEASTIDPAALKKLGRADFDGLSAADTKDLLKKDARFTTNIIKRYEDVDIKFSYNALDKAVDLSVPLDGSFPAKALRTLDLAAATKAIELKAHAPGAKVVVNSSTVGGLFENHTGIIDKLKPEQGQFVLAENIKTKMADVGGISTIKEQIQEDILNYLKDPKKFAATGGVVPSGKLLTGPPGNGKTLLARAIAGETGIPFIAASGSEFVEKYVGVGAQRMRELFENAKKAAAASEKKMAIIFIDEIDAFAKIRGAGGDGGESESEKTLNQLLTEMDGFNKNSKIKVFVLAATNRKDIIDPALIRSGRMDAIEVPSPATHADRLEILNIHARKKNFASEAEKAKILNGAAKMTEGMSGADLAGVLEKAAKVVSKRAGNRVITYDDMTEGFMQVAVGVKKKSELSLEEKIDTAGHEWAHANVMTTVGDDKISFITLEERGHFLGAVFTQPSKKTPNLKSVIYSAAVDRAGGIGETGFKELGHGAGVSQDLKASTNIIKRAVTKWGLGVYTPQISIDENDAALNKMYELENKKDIELFSSTAEKIAQKITDSHQGFREEYLKEFEKNLGKGGTTLSGEAFVKMKEDWLIRNGKTEAEAVLKKGCDAFVAVVKNSKVWFEQTGKNINPIFERGIEKIIDTPQSKEWAKKADKPEALAKLMNGIDSIVKIVQNPGSLNEESHKVGIKNIEAELNKRISTIVEVAKGEKASIFKKVLKAFIK